MQLLASVANELRRKRGDLIGAMIADTGNDPEADSEISEAIDFAKLLSRESCGVHQLPVSANHSAD